MSSVGDQYNEWVYPIPIEDMRAAIANGSYWEIGDPLLYGARFWPRNRSLEKLDVLIAGCGSVQAAYYACRNPNWNVVGIDISDSSLAHQNKLKARHGLSNLHVQKLDLTEVYKLGSDFDFIVSTGVIHHLPDPIQGLASLKDVLRPDGVINLMVYGKSLRLGVYLMQDLFRLLNFQQTQTDVDIVKATINDLAPDHVVKRYVKVANDLHYDAAYVDTFLHPLDTAFYVNDVYQLTREAGLEFLTWCDPAEYSLDAVIPEGHPLWRKLQNLSPQTAAHVCDLLTQLRGTHRWAAAHPDYVRSVEIPFDSDALYDCAVMLHRHSRIVGSDRAQIHAKDDGHAACVRANRSYPLRCHLDEIITRSDGVLSVRQLVSELALSDEERTNVLRNAREQLQFLWRQGDIHIYLPQA